MDDAVSDTSPSLPLGHWDGHKGRTFSQRKQSVAKSKLCPLLLQLYLLAVSNINPETPRALPWIASKPWGGSFQSFIQENPPEAVVMRGAEESSPLSLGAVLAGLCPGSLAALPAGTPALPSVTPRSSLRH